MRGMWGNDSSDSRLLEDRALALCRPKAKLLQGSKYVNDEHSEDET